MNFFKISGRSVSHGEWGDYGDILQHGMTAHSRRVDGKLALERTGPYIPPITLPGIGDIVLTSEARQLLEASDLSGFSFAPVEKKLIVELPWETWDLHAEDPAELPESGEPEDYVLGKPHSPTAAGAIGDLWEIAVPRSVTILRSPAAISPYVELRIDLGTWNGGDLIRSEGYGAILFTEPARDWFTKEWAEYILFDPFPTT